MFLFGTCFFEHGFLALVVCKMFFITAKIIINYSYLLNLNFLQWKCFSIYDWAAPSGASACRPWYNSRMCFFSSSDDFLFKLFFQYFCGKCDNSCKNAGGLAMHMKTHKQKSGASPSVLKFLKRTPAKKISIELKPIKPKPKQVKFKSCT